jgi:hypothetical protein
VANRLATLVCAYACCDLANTTATTTANTTTSGSSSGSSSGGSDSSLLGSLQLRCVLVPPPASTLSAAASPTRRHAESAVVVDGANAQARDLWLCVFFADSVASPLAGSSRSNRTVFVFCLLVSERPCFFLPRVAKATQGTIVVVVVVSPGCCVFFVVLLILQPTPCLPFYFMNE